MNVVYSSKSSSVTVKLRQSYHYHNQSVNESRFSLFNEIQNHENDIKTISHQS